MQEMDICVFKEFMKSLHQRISSDLFKSLNFEISLGNSDELDFHAEHAFLWISQTLRLGVYGHSVMRRISTYNSCKPSIIRI